jgi:uncharacterized membrane protein
MTEDHSPRSAISRSRLEFLFDGVFAIAMTLLVLELRVPEIAQRHSAGELAHGLALQGSTFASYLLSFIVLGMFWYRHNHQYPHFQTITRTMLVLHFVQLAAAASFPFCAALFGRYPFNPLSGFIYTGCVLVYALASLAVWLIAKRSGSIGATTSSAEYAHHRQRLARWCVLVAAVFLSYLFRLLP